MSNSFRGELFFLSNFYPSRFILDGILYDTVEHYYQSQKTIVPFQKERIRKAQSPLYAKRYGRKCTVIADWDRIKDDVMFKGVFAKFSQDPELKMKLLETDDELLVERNDWNDRYWGVNSHNGVGLNKLGNILKDVKNIFLKNKELK